MGEPAARPWSASASACCCIASGCCATRPRPGSPRSPRRRLVLMYPLFLVIFGRSARTIIMIGFVAGLPPVILKTIEGLAGTRRVLIDVGRSFKLTPSQLFWKILFPAALPTIFVGVRLGMIFALINIVGVEFLINFGGLGQLDQRARRALRPARHLCGDLLRDPGQRRVLRRHRTDRAMAETGRLTRATAPAAPCAQPGDAAARSRSSLRSSRSGRRSRRRACCSAMSCRRCW